MYTKDKQEPKEFGKRRNHSLFAFTRWYISTDDLAAICSCM